MVARRKGTKWYVAGITGDISKKVKINLSFLGSENYQSKLLVDGPNAFRVGTDYLWEERVVDDSSVVEVEMVNGGGFLMELNTN